MSTRGRRAVLAAFSLSGAAALVYEITWTRALSLVLGSTTYAVSTMLATFMAGLAIGGMLGGFVADRVPAPALVLGLCELGIGVTGTMSVPLTYALPEAYFALYHAFHGSPLLFFPMQVGLCALVMLLPTVLMGATFPLVARATTPSLEALGRTVGTAYSVNTIGAVAGALCGGFVLVPAAGLEGAVAAAGLVNIGVGVALVLASRRGTGLLAGALVLFASVTTWSLTARAPTTLYNFYSAYRFGEAASLAQAEPRSLTRLWQGRDVEGPVEAFRDAQGNLVLEVAGKIEGSSARDLATARLLAYLPLAAHPHPRSMLVIGVGAGVTLAAARPHVEELAAIEINHAVIEAVSRFGPPGRLDGVRLQIEDARTALRESEERYDVISSEPSYPTDAAVSNLLTKEFFALAATRLTDGGIYCQWLPYYLLTNDDVTLMLKTFTGVFPHALLWKVPESLDLILIGSRAPLAKSPDDVSARVAQLNNAGVRLDYVLSRTSEQLAAIAAAPDIPENTDDRPRIEFRIADNLLLGTPAVREAGEATADMPW